MKIGPLELNDLSYILSNQYETKPLFIPLLPNSEDEYWYEDYDFETEKNNDDIKVEIHSSKVVSQVNDDSYDGDKTVYLLSINEKMAIFDNAYNSWGEGNPTLEYVEPETLQVYRSKDKENIFVIE